MLKNQFKTMMRRFGRQKLFFFLNVIGLAVGISACFIIYCVVNYEFGFDKEVPDGERIYQVINHHTSDREESQNVGVSRVVDNTLQHEITGVEMVVPMYMRRDQAVSIEGTHPVEVEEPEKQVGTTAAYFKLQPHRWLAGDEYSALDAPDKVVLTESRARQYFPGVPVKQILGKTIIYNHEQQVTVSGIVADLDYPNSFGWQEFFAVSKGDWYASLWEAFQVTDMLFVKLEKGANMERIIAQLNRINTSHNKDNFEKFRYKQWYELLPLKEVHFSDVCGAYTRTANKPIMIGLLGVAIFLILLACINYMNLSTAQAPQRAKEIGIRKTLGSLPAQLMGQFVSETGLITLFSTLLSFFLSFLVFRFFKEFMPEGMEVFQNPGKKAAFLMGLMLLTTILAGIYPAWLSTKVKTASVLKGNKDKSGAGSAGILRKGLIVFQFVVAQVFIIGAIIVGNQLHYMQHNDLGFNYEAVLTIPIPASVQRDKGLLNNKFIFKDALGKHPEIAAVALGDLPMDNGAIPIILNYQSDSGQVQTRVNLKFADEDYMQLYHLKLLAGKPLAASDTGQGYIINEAELNTLGIASPEAAIGKMLYNSMSNRQLPVMAVVRDFHQHNYRSKIGPVTFMNVNSELNTVNIKLSASHPEDWNKAIQLIGDTWKGVYPNVPFIYKFYDETIANLYKQDRNTAKLISVATGTSIFISCLGLLGLSTLTAFQRSKEIGIRKVLGANVTAIVRLLSADFLSLVLLSVIIASPIAWWATSNWLQDFAYHITIQWWMFALAAFLSLLAALLTIGFQVFKAAVANPVDSLRDE